MRQWNAAVIAFIIGTISIGYAGDGDLARAHAHAQEQEQEQEQEQRLQQEQQEQQEQAKKRVLKEDRDGVVLYVRISPDSELESRLTMLYPRLAQELAVVLRQKQGIRTAEAIPVSDVYVRLSLTNAEYMLGSDGTLYSAGGRTAIALPIRLRTELLGYAEQLRRAHYGELLPWKEAKKIVPKKQVVTVVDVETGLSFQAQRRAGQSHADVQPLTAADSAIMKQMYQGKWSWSRKAILVKTDGRVLAASMHGMPHGGDGIPGNNFAGHFCIHFLDSTTHGSKKTDPDHQLMVWKASGQVDLYLARMSPEEVIDTFFSALHVKDEQLLRRLFTRADDPLAEQFLTERDQYIQVGKRVLAKDGDADNLLSLHAAVDVRVYQAGGGKPSSKTLLFRLQRNSPVDPWKIAHVEEQH